MKDDMAIIKIHSRETLWGGTYRKVNFCIKRRYSDYYRCQPFIALYLYLRREQCSDFDSLQEYELGSVNYKYGILSKIPFHGGITFFEKYGDNCELKIGCDYNHLYDNPNKHTLDDLKRDVRIAIDSVWDLGILNTGVKNEIT